MAEKIKVDFSQVEDAPDYSIENGKYKVSVVDVEKKEGNKAPYLKWTLKLLDGKSKGLQLFLNTSLSPSALFKLREVLESLGIKVPKSAVSLDPAKVKNLTMGVVVENKPYEGNMYPNVVKTFPLTDDTGEEIAYDTEDFEDEIVLDL